MYEQGEHDKMGKAEMGQILQASWEGVSPQVLEDAWQIVDEDTMIYVNQEQDEDEEECQEEEEESTDDEYLGGDD